MANPDFKEVIDLRPFDLEVQTVFELGLEKAQDLLPGWAPKQGHIEVVILEAMALMIEQLGFTYNRLPPAMLVGLLRLHGIEPDLGSAPTATIIIRTDMNAHVIPQGTMVILPVNAAQPFRAAFTTDADVSIASNVGVSAPVAVTALDRFSAANGTPTGTGLEMVDRLFYVDSVALASAVTGGVDPEDGEAYRLRGSQVFARITLSLVRAVDVATWALEQATVGRALGVDSWDGVDEVTIGDDLGFVIIVAYGQGLALTGPQIEDLELLASDKVVAHQSTQFTQATITDVPVDVRIRRLPGSSPETVEATCVAALNEYLNPMTWDWGRTVEPNDIIALLDVLPGVDLVTLFLPAAPVVLSPRALPDTVTAPVVSVVDPSFVP